MTRLEWGKGPRLYDRGVDQGVLYLDGTGVPWNGLVSVEERATGDLDTDHYFDGNRFHISQAIGDFEAVVSAYTYPEAFNEYNGYSEHEKYKRFGLSFRSQHSTTYKMHLVYNAMIRNDVRARSTISETPNPSLFDWELRATSIPIPGAKPAAHLIMEVPLNTPLTELEDILYGTETTEPRLPEPSEIIDRYESATTLRITYHSDGSYTASGPDEVVQLLSDGRFELNAPTVFFLGDDEFSVQSY